MGIKLIEQNKFLQKFWWIFPVIFLVTAASYSFLLFTKDSEQQLNSAYLPLVDCLGTTRENDIDCWYERYEKLINQEPNTEKAFDDVKSTELSSTYVKSNCHQIAHIIGRAAGKKYGNISTAYQDGDSYCWSGYYHGVMESISTFTEKQEILDTINTICADIKAKESYSFFHFNCVHGLGHGLMQIQDNNLFSALSSCEGLFDKWEQDSCFGGVFMENVMNEINPGHTSAYLKDDEPLYPCTEVAGQYKEQCYLMQTSHALIAVNQDFEKVFKLCESVSEPFDKTCYQSLGRDASGQSSSDITKTIQLCSIGKTKIARENCFIGAVKDFISYYSNDSEGLLLCNSVTEAEIQQSCLKIAKEYYQTF